MAKKETELVAPICLWCGAELKYVPPSGKEWKGHYSHRDGCFVARRLGYPWTYGGTRSHDKSNSGSVGGWSVRG